MEWDTTMKKSINIIAVMGLSVFAMSPLATAYAADIMNEKQCQSVIKDTEEAISSNPSLGEKYEKVLMEIMALAKKRCDDKEFANAAELLAVARGMVASE